MILYHTPGGGSGYLYLPRSAQEQGFPAPLVMMLCGRGHGPEEDAAGSGWLDLAAQENICLMLPIYDSREVYDNISPLAEAVTYITGYYPVIRRRVYAAGFSNGGAAAAALAAEHPALFAGVSAMSWLIRPRRAAGGAVPFQLIQGSRDGITRDENGSRMVMRDERDAIRYLMEMNGMQPAAQPDYRQTPYWGWMPDDVQDKEISSMHWIFSHYRKDGYAHPFMQLVMAEGGAHRTNPLEAQLAWQFLRPFARGRDGRIYEDKT